MGMPRPIIPPRPPAGPKPPKSCSDKVISTGRRRNSTRLSRRIPPSPWRTSTGPSFSTAGATMERDELQEIIKNAGKYDGDDEQLQRFKELADTIQAKQESVKALGPQVDPAKKKQEFDDSLRAGDEAYGKGLLAKAAAAYAKAFRADPTQGEIGLRAAMLYGDRLKNLTEAAVLWQQVLAAGEPHATTARAELQSHREALDA